MRLCWVRSNIFMAVTVGETWAAASWWHWETREQEEEDEADGQVPGAGAACGQWCSHARMMPRYHQTPVSSSQSRRITAVNCSFCLCPELTKRDLVIIDWGCYQQHWSFNMKQEKWDAGVSRQYLYETLDMSSLMLMLKICISSRWVQDQCLGICGWPACDHLSYTNTLQNIWGLQQQLSVDNV